MISPKQMYARVAPGFYVINEGYPEPDIEDRNGKSVLYAPMLVMPLGMKAEDSYRDKIIDILLNGGKNYSECYITADKVLRELGLSK